MPSSTHGTHAVEKMSDRIDAKREPDSATEYRGNQPKSTRELSEWHTHGEDAAVIDPGMPIVDTHHHLFGSSEDAHFYQLADLHSDVDSGHRIIGTVYVEAYMSGWRQAGPEALRPVGEVEMIEAKTRTPLYTALGDCHVAAAIVSHADLTLGDQIAEVLHEQLRSAQGRLRGVRHRAATVDGALARFTPDGRRTPHLLSDPAFRRGFAQLESLGLSFDAWIYHTQISELIELADTFPNTTIVVNHIAGPIGVAEFRSRHVEVLREWEGGVQALAARPNVCMKVGGMGMPLFGFGFENRDRPPCATQLAHSWMPYIETCVEAFGTSRCMFESNFPVDKQSCSYTELWNAFKIVTQGWSLKERSDVFYRTACRTYRLPSLESLGDQLIVRAFLDIA